ncbi:HD domain-containing protein [Parasphingorhabdus cellanae]|uniref:HD domain-containing protein n=1 Tax=Parasphingorhabdus cellanae TaxID=2806553 RepID=A0ABX7T688_9SPHN|nr:HD domain-containing protein [Parasphingorhabdus cellanae]QTD55483.1 HD domain-containing protein [Parasphingorhabdus cellanae]
MSTKSFQRLHNVRQLGLAHLVFPSASYSRFSHSVGAAVNARRIMESINHNRSRQEFSERDIEIFRIGALFHDLGHYPFSHSTEHSVGDYYSGNFFESDKSSNNGELWAIKSSFEHEKLGEKILELDTEISEILDDLEISFNDIKNKFVEKSIKTIISSDLDCDRLDYLKRTAHHSGAPYGSVDVDFIISQATLDKDRRYCFSTKALRAVDHLLVGRFFDFSQIPYHKTVAALEWSLDAVTTACLDNQLLSYSQDDVIGYISEGTWHQHDESLFVNKFRELQLSLTNSEADNVISDHLNAVLFRKAAKQIFSIEKFSQPGNGGADSCRQKCEQIRDHLISNKGLDPDRLYVWEPRFRYAKSSPVSGKPLKELSEDEKFELVHILPTKASKKSKPLVELNHSLAHQIAPIRYDIARVYYLLSENDDSKMVNDLRKTAEAL